MEEEYVIVAQPGEKWRATPVPMVTRFNPGYIFSREGKRR